MKVLIPFSSGLDSTYLIYKNLKEGNNVVVCYFEILNNVNKSIVEKIHREYLIKQFEKDFKNKIVDLGTILQCEVNKVYNNSCQMNQIPIWLLGLYFACGDNIDEIQLGYVCGDDAISYLDDIKKLFKKYNKFSNKKFPKINFPLIKTLKKEITYKLPEKYKKFTISCEDPRIIKNDDDDFLIYKLCGDCDVCKKYSILDVGYENIDNITYNKKENTIEKTYVQYEKEIMKAKEDNLTKDNEIDEHDKIKAQTNTKRIKELK